MEIEKAKKELAETIEMLQGKSQIILAKQLETLDNILSLDVSKFGLESRCLLIDTLGKLNNDSLIPMTVRLIEILGELNGAKNE